MQYGLFMMPMHLPEKPVAQTVDEDIELLLRADALGYGEAWIGEHFTSAWENIPAPDLLIARVAPQLRQMILAPAWCCCSIIIPSWWPTAWPTSTI
jgi:alkanesulfonate monooxygenase SsuD/methylene tetrahydromethanopterin reductase-like flavin-dependent oxidoreductase (luciferase family)